jgi:hypothetical protein
MTMAIMEMSAAEAVWLDVALTTPLWCPLPPAIHPEWQSWERRTVAWMERFGLDGEQLEAGRLRCITAGELAGRTALNPAHAAGPQFSADSLLWLFAFDDAYCDEGRYSHSPAEMAILVAEMMRIVETGRTSSASPCARGLADLRQRLDGLASAAQIARWVSAMRGYLSYQVWEAAYRSTHRMPTLNEYAIARIRNGSMEICAMAVDISEGYEVAPAELESADVRALTEMACAIVGLDNDIASYHKEHLRSTDKLNLVDVIAHERGRTPNQVLPEAVAFRDAVLDLYLRLCRQVEPQVGATTRRYIAGLSAWIRGNLDWSMHTGRYRKAGKETIWIVDVPYLPAAEFSPPEGVAWWWARLRHGTEARRPAPNAAGTPLALAAAGTALAHA